jgi:hypothetical protein
LLRPVCLPRATARRLRCIEPKGRSTGRPFSSPHCPEKERSPDSRSQ